MTATLIIICAVQAAALGYMSHKKAQLELRERLRSFGAKID